MKAFLTISLIFLLIIQLNSQTADNTKCWQAQGTTKCIFCRASYTGLQVTSTWGLMMTKGKINGQTLAFAAADPNEAAFNCYPNNPSLNYTCTLSPIEKCEIYDFYGKCIRCACNFAFWPQTAISVAGGEPQSKTCVENSLRVPYCDEYDISGQCIRCKWNQAPGDEYDPNYYTKTVTTMADQSSNIYVSGERNMLDYGLWNQICYDNSVWKTATVNPNTNAVSNCKLYDSTLKTGSPNCQACHSRDYNFHSNSEWNTHFSATLFSDANWQTLQNNFQKIHWDFILSSTTSGGVTTTSCVRFPTHYIGYPKDLLTVAYYANTNNKGSYQIDPTNGKSACQSGQIFVTQCGYPIGGTSCPTTSDNDFVTCSKKITNCKQYVLATVKNYDRLGQQQTTTTAQFIYKVVTQCTQCDDTYVLSPDGQTCTQITDAIKNPNCKQAATSDLTSCASCLTGTLYLNAAPGSSSTPVYKCATITAISNCASHYLSGTNYLCAKCSLGYARSKDDDRCIYLGTRWIAALQASYLFGCGKLSNTADSNLVLTPTMASCSTVTDITAGGCADGFTQVTSGSNKYCQCSGGLSISSYLYCQPLPTASAPSSIQNPVSNCTQNYNHLFSQCRQCTEKSIRSESWKECILTLAAPDSGNCVAYTSQGSCRYCKFGLFLDQQTLTCIVDTDKTNYNNQVTACAFGKLGTKSDFTVDSKTVSQYAPTCTSCQVGYALRGGVCKSMTILTLSPSPVKWCVNYNTATGLCTDCPTGTADVWAVPATSPTDDNIPVSALYRMCGAPIANCKVVDSSLLACMQCDFKGNSQLGVAKDGTCQTCTTPNQMGLSYDGKQVCVTTVDANCIVYGYDGLCAGCKANQYLYYDGTCKADCTTGITGFKAGKVFNDYKEVPACVPADGQTTVNFAATTTNTSPCNLWFFASRILTTASSNYKCSACSMNYILQPSAANPPVYSCLQVSFLDDSCNAFNSDYSSCDNTPTPTGQIPVCKPTDTSGVATFFKSDYGFICSGTASPGCANQCVDNSLGGVANCFSYYDSAKQAFIDPNGLKDKCCKCKKGYDPQAGATDCGITSCTKKVDCTLFDSNDNCLQCAKDYKLQLSDTTGLRTCVQTCGTGTAISIFTGYSIVDGCLPTGLTLNQFKDTTIANCGLWYFLPFTGTKLSNANAIQCIKCATGKILTPSAYDLSTYGCQNDGVGNGQSNVPSYIGQTDGKCSRVGYLSLSPKEKYPECLIGGTKNTDYTIDYGLTCKGSDAASCVQQCIDNKNNVPNCNAYITTLTADTQFVAADTGLTNKCCQCKTGFFNDADQTTTEDKNCGISKCISACLLKDSKGLCAQCASNYMLTTERKCVKTCPQGTTAKKAFMADIYQQVDACVDISKAQTNYDADGATNCAVYSFPLESVTVYDKIFCLQCAKDFNLLRISESQYTCTSNTDAKFSTCNIVTHQCDESACIIAGQDNGYYCQGADNTNCIGKCVSNANFVANCKTYCKGVNGPAAGKCCACQDGFVGDQAVATSSGTITKCSSAYPNCISLDDSTPQLCSQCAAGYSLTETRSCILTTDCTNPNSKLKAVVQVTATINIIDVPVCLKVNSADNKLTNKFTWTQGFDCGIVNLIRVKDEAGLAAVQCIECSTTTQILTPAAGGKFQCQEPNAGNADTNNLVANSRASDKDSTQTTDKQGLDKTWFSTAYGTSEICKSDFGYQQTGGVASCAANTNAVANCATYVPESQLGSQATNDFQAKAAVCCRCKQGFTGDKAAATAQDTTCSITSCTSQIPDNCAKYSKGLCHQCKDSTFYLDQTLKSCKNAGGAPANTVKIDTSVTIRGSPFPQSAAQNAFIPTPPTDKSGALYTNTDADLNKDLCQIFSFDPATQTATDFNQVGCTKCKTNYILTKVTGNKYKCVYNTQISSTCATASATYLCDGTLWKSGTTYGKDVTWQQPCTYASDKDYQFVAQNLQNGQCQEQTAVAKCTSYYPQTGATLQDSQFGIAIANLAGKCCMCKNQYVATAGDAGTCTISKCELAESAQTSVCISWVSDSKTPTTFICNQCAKDYTLTLSRQCVKTCPSSKDGTTAGGHGFVFVPGNTDFVDGCVFTDQSKISATNFIYLSTATCKTFKFPDFADADNNYNLNLQCYACDQNKPQILYQTKKYQTSPTDNTQSVKTAWRCLDQSVLEMGPLKDKQTGMRFLPTKPMCDERKGQANFQCIPYVSGNTNYGDYAYVQNSANGLAQCIQNTATPASTTKVIPNCKSYYVPQTTADGAGYAITDDRAALEGNCNECQKGYVEQRANNKITACNAQCLTWDATEKFCVQCPDKQFLQFDGTCVATCADTMKTWAWTGYYTMVQACFDTSKLTANSLFTMTAKDTQGNSVTTSSCAVWNFGPVAKPGTAVTATSIDSVQCYSCGEGNMLSVKANVYSCLPISDFYYLSFNNNFCSSLDTTSSTVSKTQKGNCQVDSCRNESSSIVSSTSKFVSIDYGFVKDGTPVVGRCTKNDDYVPHCLTYISASKNVASADLAKKLCCACKQGYWPVYSTDSTLANTCNILKCQRHQNAQITDTTAKSNCLAWQLSDKSAIKTFQDSTATPAVKTNCGFCAIGYFNNNDDLVNCVAPTTTPSFACQYISGGVCARCFEPQILIGSTCVDKVDKCIQYSNTISAQNTGTCTLCEWPYYLNANAQCIISLRGCAQMYQSGADYDILRPKCQTCMKNWYNSEGLCYYGCARVKKQWNNSTKTYQAQCCTCLATYRMADTVGTCQACISNCDNCTTSVTACDQCSQGYYYNKLVTPNVCTQQATVATCLTYSIINSGWCATCQPNNFLNAQGVCGPYTTIDNCITYNPNANQCSACTKRQYFINGQFQCVKYTQVCLDSDDGFNPTADLCLKCPLSGRDQDKTVYYYLQNGQCKIGTILNCVQYNQTANQMICTKCDDTNLGYGLDSTGSNCLDNTLTKAGGTPHCYQYNPVQGSNLPTCKLCADPTAVSSTSWALVTNEQDVSKQCQQISYCLQAFLQRQSIDSLTEIYNCTMCAAKVGSTNIYANLKAFKLKSSTASTPDTTQCQQQSTGVRNCLTFNLADGADHTSNCIGCQNGYTPEQGGTVCKPNDLFCESKGCLNYVQNTNYEWIKCALCTQYYFGNDNQNNSLSLNYATQRCDLNTTTNDGAYTYPPGMQFNIGSNGTDGGLAPTFTPPSDGGTQDGGTNPQPPNPQNPSGKFATFTSIGFETLLIVILGFLAFII